MTTKDAIERRLTAIEEETGTYPPVIITPDEADDYKNYPGPVIIDDIS